MYGEVVARPGIDVADGVHRSLRKTADSAAITAIALRRKQIRTVRPNIWTK